MLSLQCRLFLSPVYFQQLEQKSHLLLLRAENYLEKGIQTARRQQWKGEEVKYLQERLQHVRKEKKERRN